MPRTPPLPTDVDALQRRVAELEAAQRETEAERTRTARLLAGSETRFRSIFEYLYDAILLIDPDLDEILDVNGRACRLLGYTQQELQSLPVSAVFGQDMARLQAFALSVAEAGHGWMDEVGCRTRTGGAFDAEISASEVPLSPERSCVLLLLRDITERKAADAEIRASLQEKEILLREVHHRVKNNLQVVSSLFDLQAERTDGEAVQSMLRECRNRVRSMSVIHESLYRAHDLSRVDFRRYVDDLTEELLRSFGAATRIALQLELDDVTLDVDQAIPCGLIVNELVSNALKYAYPKEATGRLWVGLEVTDELVLTVADEGVGLPADLDVTDTPSLGLRLVHNLVHQLCGRLAVDAGPTGGARFTIRLPRRG